MKEKIASEDWQGIRDQMNEKGYAIISQFLPDELCQELISYYSNQNIFRKTVVMERYRFGLGEYKYFNYPLPGLIQDIREHVYPYLAPIANSSH